MVGILVATRTSRGKWTLLTSWEARAKVFSKEHVIFKKNQVSQLFLQSKSQ